MKELEFLHYRPGNTVWHRHDPRLKLAELAAWSILALAGNERVLAAIGIILTFFHIMAKTSLRRMRRPLFFWTFMAAAIILAAGFAEASPALSIGGYRLPIGKKGLLTGTLRAGRLLAVLLAGQLLASGTDPADLAGAVRKMLFFLPKQWTGAIASSLMLTISFIPLIMDETVSIRDAAMSRGLQSRKSIFRRAAVLALPMAESALKRSDITSEALISRCFTEDPTEPNLIFHPGDWLILLVALAPPIAVAVLTGK